MCINCEVRHVGMSGISVSKDMCWLSYAEVNVLLRFDAPVSEVQTGILLFLCNPCFPAAAVTSQFWWCLGMEAQYWDLETWLLCGVTHAFLCCSGFLRRGECAHPCTETVVLVSCGTALAQRRIWSQLPWVYYLFNKIHGKYLHVLCFTAKT